MLRPKLCVLTVAFLPIIVPLLLPRGVSSQGVVRLTTTVEQAMNLNPSLSDDGRVVVFESSSNLFAGGLNDAFHAFGAEVGSGPPVFQDLGPTRIVSPSLSSDGSVVVFASREDLVGENFDRNSEIYLRSRSGPKQLTHTPAGTHNSQPSITADGRLIAYVSDQNLALLDVDDSHPVFLTDTEGASNPKLSGDGSKLYYQLGSSLVLLDLKSGNKRIVAKDLPQISIGVGRAVSHDGMRVVYAAEQIENQSQVFLFDARDDTTRQLTQLGSRVTDVNLQPTISSDGKRVAFATRRRVVNASDGSVELYVYDIPSGQTQQITNAPASATAEVVSSLNFDGSVIAFNFPRVLSGPAVDGFENNSEIYLASTMPRVQFGAAKVLNAAALGNEPGPSATVAPGSIATIRGNALAFRTQSSLSLDPPLELAGTTVRVNGRAAPIFFVSPGEVVFVVPDELANGPAEVVATNSDGFSSKAEIVIAPAAPGIFTVTGDGKGEAIILDADLQTAGPFDPSTGTLRLSIFATGLSHAQTVSVVINGQPVKVETVVSNGLVSTFESVDSRSLGTTASGTAAGGSPGTAAGESPSQVASGLRGLDEIHVLVPEALRGAGSRSLVVTADGVQGNPVTVAIGGSALREVVINELLADPPDGLAGDANHDGVRDTADDEFVELVNSTTRDLDLSGYQLLTRSLTASADTVRHRFATGTIVPAGGAIVVFGGGLLDDSAAAGVSAFGGSLVVKASSGGVSLSNSGGVVSVRNTEGGIVVSVSYGTALNIRADQNQSITRAPDITGPFSPHLSASTEPFSPGTRLDGTLFIPLPTPSPTPTPTPTPTPSPTPTPPPTPTPMPTATPIASPSPTATPIPSPTASPSPSPTPIATPTAQIVISQLFGGGGNSNAPYRNDFIELFNRGTTPADLTGWSVQYAGATSSTWSVTLLPPTTLAPGQYFLVQQAAGANNGITLPQPDATGSIAMAAAAGKVALVKTTTALTGLCPNDPNIIDLAGYGSTASCFKGSAPAPAPSNTNAIIRKSDGCTNTLNNNTDFIASPPTPRNIASPVNICEQSTVANALALPTTLDLCTRLCTKTRTGPLFEVELQRSSQMSAHQDYFRVASTLGTDNRNRINSEGVRERFQRCMRHPLKPRVGNPTPGLKFANAVGV